MENDRTTLAYWLQRTAELNSWDMSEDKKIQNLSRIIFVMQALIKTVIDGINDAINDCTKKQRIEIHTAILNFQALPAKMPNAKDGEDIPTRVKSISDYLHAKLDDYAKFLALENMQKIPAMQSLMQREFCAPEGYLAALGIGVESKIHTV